jgi:hypothetical protein
MFDAYEPVITVIIAAVGAVIAFASVFIAHQQRRIASITADIALFDRRLELIRRMEKAVNCLITRNGDLYAHNITLSLMIMEAYYLFDGETHDLFGVLSDRAGAVVDHEMQHRDAERGEVFWTQRGDLCGKLNRTASDITVYIRPYMRITGQVKLNELPDPQPTYNTASPRRH